MSGLRGVAPLNGSRFGLYSDSALQAKSLTSFDLRSYGPQLMLKPALTTIGWFSGADCPTQSNCVHMILSQGYLGIGNPMIPDPLYYKMIQVPVFQITLSFPWSGPPWRLDEEECRRYGYGSNPMIVCVKDRRNNLNHTSVLFGEKNPTQLSSIELMIAAFTCTPNASQPESCHHMSWFSQTPIVQIDIWKRRTDLVYNIQNSSLESVEKLSPIYGSAETSATTYIDFYDRIFPKLTARPGPTEQVTIESLLYGICFEKLAHSSAIGSRVNVFYPEIVALPFLVQQEIEFELRNVLDEEHPATAMFCTKGYQLSLAPSSFYIFALFCFITIAWCLIHLSRVLLNRRPVLSDYPEVDLVAKLDRNNPMSLLGPSATSGKVEKTLGDMKIYVVQAPEHGNDGGLEMVLL
jgi:hypothetical protein